MSLLSIRNLHISLEGQKILSDVSLDVRSGKLVGLIGPNGAGKSILLKSILGVIDKKDGEITLDGKDISDWPLMEKARKISYAAQGAPVHWPLTVGHLVSLGRIPHLSPWQSTTREDQILTLEAMKKTNVDHLSMRITTTLSGGERARVMLARAIVTGAEFLLADEPIESLDPYHQIQILNILKELTQNGHGVLLIIHDLNFAQKYCDELILLDKGKVVASGQPSDVLNDRNLQNTYRIKASRFLKDGNSFIIADELLNSD
ncbi:MAG: ABC transporter ATP-binding protein [Alphaproteobacteria bacterium]|nr:ABC transporter ATP-binding protein [Alphaproteobacteria bacterium]HPF45578.1 ABC transporter ATP-binding protein [Emcibacteraceae bacterium]